MTQTNIREFVARLVKCEGISKKSGKPYTMYKIIVDTEQYGEVEMMLDTRTDRAGIILAMFDRKE